MPLRRARPSATSDSARAAKRLARIDDAFNRAAGYDPSHHDHHSPTDGVRTRRPVVPDDEEDDDADIEMDLVATTDMGTGGPAGHADLQGQLGGGFLPEAPGVDAGGGGFLLEEPGEGAGGFLPEPSHEAGGFVPEAEFATAGGFLADDDMGGGFLRDDGEEGAYLPEPAGPGAGGGFLLPDPTADTPTHSDNLDYGDAGGFLPAPAHLAGTTSDLTFAGGFLPSAAGDNDDALPTPAPLTHRLPPPPPPPARIPLARIPAALRDLGLHRVGLQGAELIGLFDQVASDDEDGLGGKSVRRERFREACQVLLGDGTASEAEDEREKDAPDRADGGGAEGDLELGEGRRRRRLQPTRRQPARRATRAHPAVVDESDGAGDDDVAARDFSHSLDALPTDDNDDDDDDDESVSFASASGESDAEATKGTKGAAAKKGGKGRRSRGDASHAPSAQDVADAADSFDLFFDESPQLAFAQGKRAIGLMELQRACRVLKEKMSDGDLNEMLEYAARSKGVVDVEAFARILMETGL
ncbi:hypothetical protein JCM3770_007068 [Rhodotorula araucariae]